MTEADSNTEDLLEQAIAIGQNMIRIADAIDQPVAGNYFSIGLDILLQAAGRTVEHSAEWPNDEAAGDVAPIEPLPAHTGSTDTMSAGTPPIDMVIAPPQNSER